MLQRAASNAYSWWMASHIRTKQSKWMEQNLHDMEEKVSQVLKLIEEDGDSFMQKAEMYYKKRPEIISFVEEFFRGYRALADRYDHLSTELQNANNTIAAVCPDQVRFGIDDYDDDDCAPRPRKPSNNMCKVPKVPKLPVKELKFITNTKKKVQEKKATKAATAVPKSGLTKEEGIGKIDKLQKRILALQTEKEFVKSSYESGLAKYWEVENEIKEMQEKVDTLQDEFGEGKLIDDDEARNLMAATALKSCKDTLDHLQKTQERAVVEAEVEQNRINDARGKLDALKKVLLSNESAAEVSRIAEERAKKMEAKAANMVEQRKEEMESKDGDDDDMTDMAEKIDVLVNKVTSLETTVSSQTALIQRLRLENDELLALIQSLEDGKKDNLMDRNHDMKKKLTEMEIKLLGVQDLNYSVEDRSNNLQSNFNAAHSNLDELSKKVKPVEDLETSKSLPASAKKETKEKPKRAKAGKEFLTPKPASSPVEVKTEKGSEVESEKRSEEHVQGRTPTATAMADESKAISSVPKSVEKADEPKAVSSVPKSAEEANESKAVSSVPKSAEEANEPKAVSSVPKSAEEGSVSRESSKVSDDYEELKAMAKVVGQASSLIANTVPKSDSKEHEYAELSQSLEETKKKLMELEANHQNELFELTLQLKELKNSNSKKDEEIRSLRLKLLDSEKSAVEETFRTNIDELLEENLDFWFRFSSTLYEVQKYQTGVKDLESEVLKLEERSQNQEGSSTSKYSVKSDVRPLYKHLREIQTELSLWVEKSKSLKEELKNRFASLCEIQEEITKALKASAEDEEFRFTSFQAAKFQGEILNMKQENNRVGDELQAGLDLAAALQRDAEKALTKLSEDWGVQGSKSRHGTGQQDPRSNVPLRSFIFGVKQKKQKTSIFSVVQGQRKYHKSGNR
ncbi:hypothetical protein GOBAR_AA30276 [Gossypium barbadense]|uniref:NAB domain-containing protein n=1 Tax=Gossypium barbadense TaxID=3634 RepID=A0A2P5WH38_GOSBA|nr:hypothetical protein GOBAR_AA30276 [Gossypium barbadense]